MILANRIVSMMFKVLPGIIGTIIKERREAKLSTSDGGSDITGEERVIIIRESVLRALEIIIEELDD